MHEQYDAWEVGAPGNDEKLISENSQVISEDTLYQAKASESVFSISLSTKPYSYQVIKQSDPTPPKGDVPIASRKIYMKKSRVKTPVIISL